MHSNWPELIERNVLYGVLGTRVIDEDKKELRRKNAILAINLGGDTIAPLGGGVMSNGSSMLCRAEAMQMLHEIEWYQMAFESLTSTCKSC